jgi:hypothetical protein
LFGAGPGARLGLDHRLGTGPGFFLPQTGSFPLEGAASGVKN